jgi:hypothetical protein
MNACSSFAQIKNMNAQQIIYIGVAVAGLIGSIGVLYIVGTYLLKMFGWM